jgi:hypothetical protein
MSFGIVGINLAFFICGGLGVFSMHYRILRGVLGEDGDCE